MKVVYDTCLYIDLLRSKKRIELFTERSHIRFLSPIVLMELRAGAHKLEQRKIIDRLFFPYSKAKRIITLHPNLFYKAGEVMAKMKIKKRNLKRGFTHDLLISLSVQSIGATLYTSNRQDFLLIQGYLPLKIEYV